MVELADTPDLGSGAFGLRVQVPSLANPQIKEEIVTVNKEITRLEQSNVKLTLTIGKDDVRSEYNGMIADYTKNIQLPGFRKGKVPKEVLERKFGDSLKQEALGRIVEKSVEEVFSDESLAREDRPLPYSRPELSEDEKLELDFDKDLQFSVIYDVLPKLTVGKWEGLTVEIPDVSVSDEDLNRELEQVRERNAIVLDKDDNEKAAKDDVVTVNYSELNDSGVVIEGTERQDFVFTLGSGYNIFRFDDDVIGMKKGETKDFDKSFADDFDDKELAGTTIKLRVSLTALKIKKLPDLDDDLAQDVDEKFNTLEDLKTSIRDRLNKAIEQRLKEIKTNQLLEKIMETTPVIIPESMIRIELDSRWRNLARRFNTDTEGLYRIMEQSGQKAASVLDEWRPAASKAIHSRLIVETLMEDLKLEASNEDMEKEIENLAEATGDSAEQIREYYQREEMQEYLKEEVKERKLFDILAEKNTVKPGKKSNYVDFMGNNG